MSIHFLLKDMSEFLQYEMRFSIVVFYYIYNIYLILPKRKEF